MPGRSAEILARMHFDSPAKRHRKGSAVYPVLHSLQPRIAIVSRAPDLATSHGDSDEIGEPSSADAYTEIRHDEIDTTHSDVCVEILMRMQFDSPAKRHSQRKALSSASEPVTSHGDSDGISEASTAATADAEDLSVTDVMMMTPDDLFVHKEKDLPDDQHRTDADLGVCKAEALTEVRMMESFAMIVAIPTEEELGSIGTLEAIWMSFWNKQHFKDETEELQASGWADADLNYLEVGATTFCVALCVALISPLHTNEDAGGKVQSACARHCNWGRWIRLGGRISESADPGSGCGRGPPREVDTALGNVEQVLIIARDSSEGPSLL
eukprot:2873634-Rhodomonas_salina.1